MDLNFDRERNLLQVKKKELLDGVAVIDDALAALGQGPKANGKAKVSNGATVAGAVTRARKPMSAKAKKAARERMLAYWASKRAEAAATSKPKGKAKR